MRALLLAAGLGTRLRPLTDVTPKCLAPIRGRPLLDIWLERLSAAGIGPYLINTHYLASQVVEYVESSKYKSLVTIVHEPVLAGTAGTLIGNLGFFWNKMACSFMPITIVWQILQHFGRHTWTDHQNAS